MRHMINICAYAALNHCTVECMDFNGNFRVGGFDFKFIMKVSELKTSVNAPEHKDLVIRIYVKAF